MSKKKTFEEYVEYFRKVHGEKFSYIQQELVKGRSTKIEIGCNTCKNVFSQSVNDHKNGCGCPYCAGRLLPNEGEMVTCDDGIEREVISLKNAKKKGISKYFTGKPCDNGHISERYIGGNCLVCQEKYYQENKKFISERMKQYREENKEHLAKYNKQYRQENKEYYSERKKQYYQENKPKINEYYRNRYATDVDFRASELVRSMFKRVIKATKLGKTDSTFEALDYSVEDFMLDMESKMFEDMTWQNHGELWHIDHAYPVTRYISEGITDPAVINALDNLIPMYFEHNLEKSAQTLEEYLDTNPELCDLYSRFITEEV